MKDSFNKSQVVILRIPKKQFRSREKNETRDGLINDNK